MARARLALFVALAAAVALALGAVLLLGAQPGREALYEEDDLSEAELAGRLSHAIDAHEKCRRHWPHLESLEAAQEIRVLIDQRSFAIPGKVCPCVVCVCACISLFNPRE